MPGHARTRMGLFWTYFGLFGPPTTLLPVHICELRHPLTSPFLQCLILSIVKNKCS